jgi:DNA-binding transcriptional ArsR family regulator
MLLQLMDGDAHSARALATVAGVAPSTASTHLRRLCDAGLVVATDAGRRRLQRLAGPQVAQLVEALAALAPPRLPARLRPEPPSGPLLRARVCYGHVAGQLGIDLTVLLRKDGVVDEPAPGERRVRHRLTAGGLSTPRGRLWTTPAPNLRKTGTVRTGR